MQTRSGSPLTPVDFARQSLPLSWSRWPQVFWSLKSRSVPDCKLHSSVDSGASASQPNVTSATLMSPWASNLAFFCLPRLFEFLLKSSSYRRLQQINRHSSCLLATQVIEAFVRYVWASPWHRPTTATTVITLTYFTPRICELYRVAQKVSHFWIIINSYWKPANEAIF